MKNKVCLQCNVPMAFGRLLNNGMVWTGSKNFQGKEFYDTCVKGCEALPAYGVTAYRCPKCNLVNLYTPEEEKA